MRETKAVLFFYYVSWQIQVHLTEIIKQVTVSPSMTREHISLSRVFWYCHVYMEMVIIPPVGKYGFWNLIRIVLAQDSHGRSILISDQCQIRFHLKESTTF